jgi:hypothetical protein|tara:strand:+ start:36 stop:332 length:297 start_codon:yes stop_codon:yes gene_type:complete
MGVDEGGMPMHNLDMIALEFTDGSGYVVEVPTQLWEEAMNRMIHYSGSELLMRVFQMSLHLLDMGDDTPEEIRHARLVARGELCDRALKQIADTGESA